MFGFKRKEAPGEAPAGTNVEPVKPWPAPSPDPQRAAPVAPAAGAVPPPEGKLLTVAEILAADDVRTKRVHVPEWGGDVIVSSLTAEARDVFEAELTDEHGQPRKLEHVRALMVAMACRREDGRLLFGPGDVPMLLAKSSAVIDRLVVEVGALDTLGAEVEAARQD